MEPGTNQPTDAIPKIPATDLAAMRAAGKPVHLIDVRTPGEFAAVHADGAILTPLDRLEPASILATHRADEAIYFICKSGWRAGQACQRFIGAGFTNVFSVEGGTTAWEQARLPVVRGKGVISLERQVRIGAGTLVLLGVGLGAFVHPWCYGLSAFVGAGLIFAGITDFCGMGMLLGRMPWNQNGSGRRR